MTWLLTLITAVYPARQTSQCLHKPVRGGLRHWCIFWFLFSALNILEPVGSNLIPFWLFLKTSAILMNYNQSVTEITYKSMRGLSEHINSKWKKSSQLQQAFIRFNEKYTIPMIEFLEENVAPNLPQILIPVAGGLLTGFKNYIPKSPLVPPPSSAKSPQLQSSKLSPHIGE